MKPHIEAMVEARGKAALRPNYSGEKVAANTRNAKQARLVWEEK